VWIENVTVVPRDAKTAAITFDISWNGSWRTEINHDAAWVFFKIQPKGEATWRHARLVADKVIDPTGYSAGKGAAVELVVPDGKDGYTGLFVRRAAPHVPANLAVSNVTVLAETPAQNTEVRAFGIVMVYVPEGPFYLGSGGAEAKGFYRYTDGSQSTQPYRVTGPGKIPIGTRDGCLWARDGGMDEDGGEIPASFPNGYAAFYFMKAQMLPAQYDALLGMLDEAQVKKRWHPDATTRSGEGPNYGYATHGGRNPMISWADGAAFTAWAGLRPMTELEWEKAIRGPRQPRSEEVGPSYWGSNAAHDWWNSLLHDNVADVRAVTAGTLAGRRFRGTHGDGTPVLPADWPQEDAVGAGLRSVGIGSMAATRLSDRRHAEEVYPDMKPRSRFRAVRTAPMVKSKDSGAGGH
jgi:formylglycine-generating enzyme required for sulfatase activity